jgi:ElaB/YqjD/DUF883 family membrane-anchored ribosome-binding protein
MPRENELPEGTDHIINGAMETGAGTGGGSPTGSGTSSGGGFVAASGGNDTGGAASGGEGAGVVDQLRSQAYQLRDQGADRVRDFATGGKTRASDALEELSRVFADTADTIDERLGRDYGEYARRAADTVSGFAETLRSKDVDDIYDTAREAVRKSPGIAIGVAAVVGFALARVVKAGLSSDGATASGGGGTIGSGTRSNASSGGGGTLGSGTRTAGTSATTSDGGGTIGSGTRSDASSGGGGTIGSGTRTSGTSATTSDGGGTIGSGTRTGGTTGGTGA